MKKFLLSLAGVFLLATLLPLLAADAVASYHKLKRIQTDPDTGKFSVFFENGQTVAGTDYPAKTGWVETPADLLSSSSVSVALVGGGTGWITRTTIFGAVQTVAAQVDAGN